MFTVIATLVGVMCFSYGAYFLIKKRDAKLYSKGVNFIVNYMFKQVREKGHIELVIDGNSMTLVEKIGKKTIKEKEK